MSAANIDRVLWDLQDNGCSSITDLVNRLGLSRRDIVTALLALESKRKTHVIVAEGKVNLCHG